MTLSAISWRLNFLNWIKIELNWIELISDAMFRLTMWLIGLPSCGTHSGGKLRGLLHLCGIIRWLGKDMQNNSFSFSRHFIFLTFHFRFPDFSLPFSRLFTSGSKKSGKRKWKVGKTEVKSRENKKKHKKNFFSWKKSGKWKVGKMKKKCFCMAFPSHRRITIVL